MKNLVLLLVGLFLLGGCSESSNEEWSVPENENVIVRFDLQLKPEVLPFPATKGIPPLDVQEPTVEENEKDPVPTDKELADFCNTIEYILFREEETGTSFYKRKTFTLQDEDFSIVYDTLARGRYHICFVAHSSEGVTIEKNLLQFDEVGDTFYKKVELAVNTSDEIIQDVELERIVSRVEFMARDLVPEEAKQLDMEVTHWNNAFDLLTGTGKPSESPETFTHVFTPEEKLKEHMIHSFYTFVPDPGVKLSVKLKVVGEGETLLRDRTVAGIVPYRNRIIRYKGLLYSLSDSEETFQLVVFNNGEWEEVQESELPDRE